MSGVDPIVGEPSLPLEILEMEGLVEQSLEPGRRVRLHDEIVETRVFGQSAISRIAKGAAGHEPNLP